MSYCVHCGAEIEEGSKFCTSCGAKVEQDAEQLLPPDSGRQVSDAAGKGNARNDGIVQGKSSGKSPNKAVIVLAVALAVAIVTIVSLVLFVHSSSGEGSSTGGQSQPTQQQSGGASSSSSSETAGTAGGHGSDSASHRESASASSSGGVSVSVLEGFRDGAGSGALTDYSASSVLPASEYGTYVASNLDDGALDTAWVEGASGSGAGQSAKMSDPSGNKMTVSEVELMPGYAKSEDIYYKNARPKQVSVVADSGKVVAQVTLSDSYREVQAITFPAVSTSSLALRIDSVYAGNKYDDCAISEMRCY